MNTNKRQNGARRTIVPTSKPEIMKMRGKISITEVVKPPVSRNKKEVNKKKVIKQPTTTSVTTVRHVKGTEKEQPKDPSRLTALEELFPKHVLEEIRNGPEPNKPNDFNLRFYNMLVGSLYATDTIKQEKSPENMNFSELEDLIAKTQTDMQEVEEMIQAKDRQRARLMRWWEVKHDMLTYLFQCKGEREKSSNVSSTEINTSVC